MIRHTCYGKLILDASAPAKNYENMWNLYNKLPAGYQRFYETLHKVDNSLCKLDKIIVQKYEDIAIGAIESQITLKPAD